LNRVKEFRDLVECARAIGIFKWLAENNIPLEAAPSLTSATPQRVFTPHHVDPYRAPRLEEITFTAPLLQFDGSGPTDIFSESGEHTRIHYKRGHVSRIVRGNGRTLDVYTDDLGNPIGVEIHGVGSAAFSYVRENYVLLLPDVRLKSDDEGRVITFTPVSSSEVPESDPWGLINAIAKNFLRN
jgi:hypothetical protein